MGLEPVRERIERAFLDACILDVLALKPGNVGIHAAGHGMDVLDFVRSARVAAPAIAAGATCVGERISRAVAATHAEAGINTNLGIVLLAAPLVQAAYAVPAAPSQQAFCASLARVLSDLTVADAALAFEAIRLANPGGLGVATRHDVREPARVSLLEAMREAAGRDSIARQYVTAYADIVETGLRRLSGARARGRDHRTAVTEVFLGFLSSHPDSHVQRKFGPVEAEALRCEAGAHLQAAERANDAEELLPALRAWDRDLKARGLNPGTSADLTVATLFWSLLLEQDLVG